MALTDPVPAGGTSVLTPGTHERVEPMQLRVLYAGDMEFARAQFASSARQLTLVPMSDVAGAFGGRGTTIKLDVAVIDAGAPGMNVPQVISQVRSLGIPIPIVLVIDPGVENGASMALTLQTDDYTVKTPGWLARLPVRLQIVVSRHRRLNQLETSGQLEERLKAAVERAPVCMARVLDDGSVAAMNDAAQNMLAVSAPADFLKKPFAGFVAASHHQALTEFVATVCGGEARAIELPIAPQGGTERIVELKGVALPEDGSKRRSALVVMRDFTEKRRLEDSVLDAATEDAGAQRAEAAQLSAEITDLKNRLADSERQQLLLAHDRDAYKQASEAAATEIARAAEAAAERERARTESAEIERLYQEARTQLEEAARTNADERQQAATRLREAVEELHQERQRREALEQKLDEEERRLFEAVVARDAAGTRVADLIAECDKLRAAVAEQTRSADADRANYVARIQELERGLHEARDTDRNSYVNQVQELEQRLHEARDAAGKALDQERQARTSAELRLTEVELRAADQQRQVEEAGEHRRRLEEAVAQASARVRELEASLARITDGRAADAAAAAAAAIEQSSKEAALREQTTAIEALSGRLRDAEAAAERAKAEREQHEQTVRASRAELNQMIEWRRAQRQELLAALTEVQQFEQLAAERLERCNELERRLRAAKTEFDELTSWATSRAARVAEGLQ